MAEEKFISTVSSADFDAALTGGLAFSRGEWASDEQKVAFMEKVVEALPVYAGEVEDA